MSQLPGPGKCPCDRHRNQCRNFHRDGRIESPLEWLLLPDGTQAYVTNGTNGGSGTVSVIDIASNTVIKTIPVGAYPTFVAVASSAADWTQFHRDNMQRWNPYETVLGVGNVGGLKLKWSNIRQHNPRAARRGKWSGLCRRRRNVCAERQHRREAVELSDLDLCEFLACSGEWGGLCRLLPTTTCMR